MKNNREIIMGTIKKVVVKVGTSTLTHSNGQLHIEKIKEIVQALSELIDKGYEVLLVTSGAVGAGMGKLGLTEKPKNVSEKQAVASIGQVELTHLYQTLFNKKNKIIAQLLLTKDDFSDRKRYINARNVCNILLEKKIIPIINENDAVVANEIKVGDNDTLSALVAGLIDADLVIILSDIDGLYNKNPQKYPDAKLIPIVEEITKDIYTIAGGEGSKFGTGGMATKIIAAEMTTKIGTNLIIANGSYPMNIIKIVEKENIGTLFVKNHKKLSAKKYWLAYGTNNEGNIIIDSGAKKALLSGNSLLPIGIKRIEGDFSKGSIVQIMENNNIIAKGMTNYSSEELLKIRGYKSDSIETILGYKYDDVVVHIDNMIVFYTHKKMD